MGTDTRDILRFYRGEAGNIAGHTLEEMWGWTDQQLDMDHDWVQWAFPSNEPSRMNCDAPVLLEDDAREFQEDPLLGERVKASFARMLIYFGFEQDDEGNITPLDPTPERPNPQEVISFFNHNMLRVSRILKSLRLTGHGDLASAWFRGLLPWKDRVSGNTWHHWETAANGPI